MKPDTRTAMYDLIREVRSTFPFNATDASLCFDDCNGCSKKLLEFVAIELDSWEAKLKENTSPTFGDLDKLARTCKKVHCILQRNDLLKD